MAAAMITSPEPRAQGDQCMKPQDCPHLGGWDVQGACLLRPQGWANFSLPKGVVKAQLGVAVRSWAPLTL